MDVLAEDAWAGWHGVWEGAGRPLARRLEVQAGKGLGALASPLTRACSRPYIGGKAKVLGACPRPCVGGVVVPPLGG